MTANKNKNRIKIMGLLILILCGLLFFNEIVDTVYASSNYTITYDANGGGTFSDGSTQNIILYEVPAAEIITKTSKTSNVSEDGSSYSGSYGSNSSGITDVITIDGATSLKVTITYQTYHSNYDYVCVYDGSTVPSTSNTSKSISGKLGGKTKTTKTFTVPGDTVQFFFRSYYNYSYYGYYAVVEGISPNVYSGAYENPLVSSPEMRFAGWYTDADCTDGNELDLTTLSSDITVYAKYENAYLASGISGGVSWQIYEGSSVYPNGLLKIYPTDGVSGTLSPNFGGSSLNVPWYKYSSNIFKVVVENGVSTYSNASYMFYALSRCTEMDLSGLDTSKAVNMSYMFHACYALTSLDLSNFNTRNVTDMTSMFNVCESLTSLDLRNFDTSYVTKMSGMFSFASDALKTITLSAKFHCTSSDNPFTYGNNPWVKIYNLDGTKPTEEYLDCTASEFLLLSKEDRAGVWSRFGIEVDDETSIISGISGGVSWDLDTNGLLRIYPTNGISGVLRSLTSTNDVGWYKYKTSVKTVIVEDGVIGNTSTSYMFYALENCTEMDLSGLDTSNVTSMQEMFYCCADLTTLDLSSFDTSNVTNMIKMFHYCLNLVDLDLSSFDTSNVTVIRKSDTDYADSIFGDCESLSTLKFGEKCTFSSVADMSRMFYGCDSLTSLDLSSFNTVNATNMRDMFYDCKGLKNLNLSNFNTSKVQDMSSMFSGCSSLTELDLSSFDTSNVANMSSMFNNCSSLTDLDLSNFNADTATNMTYMFNNCSSLTDLDLSNFNANTATNMSYMFNNCSSLTDLDLSNFNASNATNMSYMFNNCSSLTDLDLSNFNTSNATNMSYMFYKCISLTDLDLSSFDTSNVTSMSNMFNNCSKLTSLDLSSFNTSNVTNMGYMFYNCSKLTSLDLSSFNTSNVTNMGYMFYNCSNLTSLNLSSFNISNVTNMGYMLYKVILEELILNDNFAFLSNNKLETSCYWIKSKNVDGSDTNDKTLYSTNKLLLLNNESTPTIGGTWINAHVLYYGTSGDCSWMIFDDGLLKIYPTNGVSGTLANSGGSISSNFAWYQYRSNVKKVVVENGVIANKNISYMFYDMYNCIEMDLSGLDTSNVTDMSHMFDACISLANLDLSSFDTSKVTSMYAIFSNCQSLTSLNLSNFNTNKVTNMGYMFDSVYKLSRIVFSDNFKFYGGINTNFYYAGDNWEKVRNTDGSKTYDKTQYTAEQLMSLSATTEPSIGGLWIQYGVTDFITNPDGSVEFISDDENWTIVSADIWTYSFKVFDDTLVYYLFEELMENYTSAAMEPYYITIHDNQAVIENISDEFEETDTTGKLVVVKTVEGNATTEDEFEFTITLSGEEISGYQIFDDIVFKDGVGKFYLKNGERKEFNLPGGTNYEVIEAENACYTSSIDTPSGTISRDVTSLVNVINTYIEIPKPEISMVNISLRKTAENYDDQTMTFVINGYFTGLEPKKEYLLSNGQTFVASEDGKGSCNVTISIDETIVFLNIPENATYQFTEEAGEYVSAYTIKNDGTNGNIINAEKANVEKNTILFTDVETVEKDENITVEFHNNIATIQNLTVSKITQMEMADGTIVDYEDTETQFEFTINFSEMDEGTNFTSTIGKIISDEEGFATKTFYLKNGESANFYDIPVGVKYQVVESPSNYFATYSITGRNVVSANSKNENAKQLLSTALETVDRNENGVVVFANIKKVTNIPIHLTKSIDTQGHDPILIELANNRMYTLDGAEYEIIVDGEVVETLVTDINGQATSTQVFENGTTGIIREIKAPDGFLLDETEYSFTIDTSSGDAYCEVAVSDVPTFDPTVFRFKKTAAGTGVAQGNTTFEGAIFKYEYFDNTDWSGTPVRTWYFETDANGLHRYHTDYLADGYTSDELYTDATGIYTFPLGSVKITEIVSPLGYKELPVMYSTITQPAMGADAKWQFTPETIAFLRTASNDMYEGDEPIDETKLGSLIVEKIDRIYLSDISDITFAGCEFTIYNMSTNPVKIGDNPIANNGEACMTIVVGEDGKATTGAVLPIGTYLVKETKGNEYYECNTDFSYEFTIHGDEENETIEVGCFNQIKAPISFIKTDENGNPLAGAKLQIKDAEGNVIDEWTSTTEAHIVRLAGGTYILHEKMPPLSYWWAEDFEFIVHTSDIGFVQLVDNDGTPVVGAEVELKLGETVCKTVTTDYQGRFTMNKFDRIGGYTVHMVDVPDGYNFGENNDFRFRMYSTDTDSLETESDNLIILDYVPIEEGDNGENPSSTVDVDEMSVTMVDKKFVHMVSSGGTGTVITVVLAAVFGCIAGGFIYIGKKKSKEDKNSNKAE